MKCVKSEKGSHGKKIANSGAADERARDTAMDIMRGRSKAIYALLEKAMKAKKSPYGALVKLLGKPIDIFYKVRRRGGKNSVVGGELWFGGDDVFRYVLVSDRCIDVRGREFGGAGVQFTDDPNGFDETEPDAPIRKVLIAMLAELYSGADNQPQTMDDFVLLAEDAIRETGRAGTAHFQRQLGWGYNKASAVMDELEKRGIIGPARGLASRKIFFEKLG